jgi:complement component 1 Q subcomponent-binding protein
MFALRRSVRLLATSVRPLVKAGKVPSQFPVVVARSFSLTTVLKKEIAHADTETQEMGKNEDFHQFKKDMEKLFQIKDEKGCSVVTLTRKHKTENITVSFNCQDVADDYEMNEDQEDQEQEEEEDEPQMGVNFEVTVEKPEGKLVAQCVGGTRGLTIRAIQHLGTGGSFPDNEAYGGPDFQALDEELQTEFFQWFDERKIDDDLSAFIHAYAQSKELNEYAHWLKKVNEFASK